jgi:DHA1 family inner membrane transport protein
MVATGLLLALVPLAAQTPLGVCAVVFLLSVSASVLVVCLQLRLMEVAGEAQMLGAALNHSALNAANALGAWLGGVVIAAGLGYTAPAVLGAGLAALGLVALSVSAVLRRRDLRAAARRRPAPAAAREAVAQVG